MYIVRPSSAATEKAAETASDRYQMNIPCECTSVTAACHRSRGGRCRRRGEAGQRSAGRLFEGGNRGLAVGQVVERLPRVARRVEARPAHQHVRPKSQAP